MDVHAHSEGLRAARTPEQLADLLKAECTQEELANLIRYLQVNIQPNGTHGAQRDVAFDSASASGSDSAEAGPVYNEIARGAGGAYLKRRSRSAPTVSDTESDDSVSDSGDEETLDGDIGGALQVMGNVPQEASSPNTEAKVKECLELLHHIPTLRSPDWQSTLLALVTAQVEYLQRGKTLRHLQGNDFKPRRLFEGGKVQSGKTLFKVIATVVNSVVGVATFIATTTIKGSASLRGKICRELSHIPEGSRPPVCGIQKANGLDGKRARTMSQHEELLDIIKNNGCIVSNDTGKRLKQLNGLICMLRGERSARRYEFVLILDEADSFQRTEDKSLCLEQERDALIEQQPLIIHYVTATLLPVFIQVAKERTEESLIFYTITSEREYKGLEDLKPMLDEDGKAVFLDYGELACVDNYMSEKTAAFLLSAFQQPRSLSLCICSPRVDAIGGLYDQANIIRNMHADAVILLVERRGIFQAAPKQPMHRDSDAMTNKEGMKIGIGEALQQVDVEHGLETPVVVVGYNFMIRGDSFRSDLRVPTHIICCLGKSMSVEKMVQACGRAAFKDEEQILSRNGFSHVTILCSAPDYGTMTRYPKILREIEELRSRGCSLGDIFSDCTIMKYASNILKNQTRTVGNKKENLEFRCRFEKPASDDDLLVSDRHMEGDCSALEKSLIAIGGSRGFRETRADHLLKDQLPGHSVERWLKEHQSRHGMSSISIKAVQVALDRLVEKNRFKKRSQRQRPVYWKVPDYEEGL